MWTRQELKAKGKAAFKRNYWKCVLASVVAILLLGAAAGTRASGGGGSLEEFQADLNAAASQAGISVGMVIAILLGIMGGSLADLSGNQCIPAQSPSGGRQPLLFEKRGAAGSAEGAGLLFRQGPLSQDRGSHRAGIRLCFSMEFAAGDSRNYQGF